MCYFVICLFFIYFVSGHSYAKQKVTYEGAQVWQTDLQHPVHVDVFQKLAHNQVISLWDLKWNVADYLVQPEDQSKVKFALAIGGLNHTVKVPDVQKLIDETKQLPAKWNETTLRIGHRLNWDSYPRLDVINEYLDYLVKTYPNLVTLSTIGKSVENRPIKLLRIYNRVPSNKVIMVTGGIHAREWIAVTSTLYLIKHIVENFHKLPNYMQNIDWKVVPVLNPDGYEYSHTTDRLWRKNRRKSSSGSDCVGVDLNRNFGYGFIKCTEEKLMCSILNPGCQPFSEPETRAIRDFLRLSKLPSAHMDIHAYGQLIIYPWCEKPEQAHNKKILNHVADQMAKEIIHNAGPKYDFGDGYHIIYPASGTQTDWVFSIGVNFSYAMEMRSDGSSHLGFMLPSTYIEPSGKDLVSAATVLAANVGISDGVTRGPDGRQATEFVLALSLNFSLGHVHK